MANVIFGFNGNEISLPVEDEYAKKLFHEITGVTIIENDDSENNLTESISLVEEAVVHHPTLQQLIELFRTNINHEISSKLIKDKFYPNHKDNWRKIFVNIYDKIQRALISVELIENGRFIKKRNGKYVTYSFVPNKISNTTLDKYGISL